MKKWFYPGAANLEKNEKGIIFQKNRPIGQ